MIFILNGYFIKNENEIINRGEKQMDIYGIQYDILKFRAYEIYKKEWCESRGYDINKSLMVSMMCLISGRTVITVTKHIENVWNIIIFHIQAINVIC